MFKGIRPEKEKRFAVDTDASRASGDGSCLAPIPMISVLNNCKTRNSPEPMLVPGWYQPDAN